MLDIRFIRDNADLVKKSLEARGARLDLSELLRLDEDRRRILTELDDLRRRKNEANDAITKLLKEKKDPKKKIAAMKGIAQKAGALEPKVKHLAEQISEILIGIPNLPHSSVPVGGVEKNQVIRTWGEPKKLDFKPIKIYSSEEM